MGVLCDLYDPSKWEDSAGTKSYLGMYGTLPGEVEKWSGLDYRTIDTLMNLNDSSHDFQSVIHFLEASE